MLDYVPEPNQIINFKVRGDSKLRMSSSFEFDNPNRIIHLTVQKKNGGEDHYFVPFEALDYIVTYPDRNEKRESEEE